MDIKNAVRDKEQYGAIVRWFYSRNTLTMEQMVLLADTIGEMSEEIFEHYKALQDLCKKEMKRIRRIYREKGIENLNLDESGRCQLAYVIEKAGSLGILLPEKYEDLAEDLAGIQIINKR